MSLVLILSLIVIFFGFGWLFWYFFLSDRKRIDSEFKKMLDGLHFRRL